MRKLCTYLIIILLATISFLFGPKDFPEAAVQKWGDFYIVLNKHLGIRVEGDAFAFVSLAISPHLLFENNQVRQSRPGFILAGHLVGRLVYAGTYPFRDQLEHFFQSRIKDKYPPKEKEKIARWFSFYSAYLLLNLLVLLVALSVFESLVIYFTGPWKNSAIRFLFLFLLVSNPVTKLFFWSPHVQILNILIPLLMLWLGLYLNRFADHKLRLYVAGGLAGILLLFYGSFLLLLPVLLYGYWKQLQASGAHWTLKKAVPLVLLLSLWVFPILAWMAIIKKQGGQFYSAEIGEYRQFIWIADTLRQSAGIFFATLFTNTLQFINSLGSLLVPVIFLFSVWVYFKRYSDSPFFPVKAKLSLALTGICCLLFFWMLGYYADRLSYSMASLLYLTGALYANSMQPARSFTSFLWFIAISWHLLLVNGNPTYFGSTYFN